MTLPKIIHRTIPKVTTPLMEYCWDTVKKFTPEYQHLTHYDEDSYEFIGDLLPLCEQGAFKADIIRLEVLYRYGGIYLDSDVELFRSLDDLLEFDGFAVAENDQVAINAVMGSTSKSKAILEMIEMSREIIAGGKLKYPYTFKNSTGLDCAFGPFVISEVQKINPEFTVLPSKDFLTFLWQPEALRIAELGNPYGMHHYAASWVFGKEGFKGSIAITLMDLTRRIKRKIRRNIARLLGRSQPK